MKESEFLRHEFNMVLEAGAHLIAQGRRSLQRPAQPYDANEVDVVYVSPEGDRCPIGFLLGDTYRSQMEGHRVGEVIRLYGDEVRRALRFVDGFTDEQRLEHAQRLQWLGKVHDFVGPMGWRDDILRQIIALAGRMLVAEATEAAGGPETGRWMPDDHFSIHASQRPLGAQQ